LERFIVQGTCWEWGNADCTRLTVHCQNARLCALGYRAAFPPSYLLGAIRSTAHDGWQQVYCYRFIVTGWEGHDLPMYLLGGGAVVGGERGGDAGEKGTMGACYFAAQSKIAPGKYRQIMDNWTWHEFCPLRRRPSLVLMRAWYA
jgi:hypothetical protein